MRPDATARPCGRGHPVVYVSGAPGAGKSTVARMLAERLGLVLVSKDVIKESLFDSLVAPDSSDALAWSRTVGGAAMELLWALAAQPAPVLLEANFRPHSDYERGRLVALGRPLVEVHCTCPPELAAARYGARALSGDRRTDVHPLSTLTPELMAEFDRPVGIGALVSVDTSAERLSTTVADEVAAVLRLSPPCR